jgi:Resolvase, N terminal domain/Helix-turn-helix domain of resolvase
MSDTPSNGLSNRTKWLILIGLVAVFVVGLNVVQRSADRDVENFKQAQYQSCIDEKKFGHDLSASMWADATHTRKGPVAGVSISEITDVLTVWKLDRLGRNTQHVLAVVDQLTSRGIGFRSLTEGLHTDGPMGKAMLTIMAAFAQLERDTMIERTRAGLAAAAANGRKGGRPRKVDDAAATKARSLREKGVNATDIAKMLGVSRATVYRYLGDDEPLSA